MRISDWSSDVCSSDLHGPPSRREAPHHMHRDHAGFAFGFLLANIAQTLVERDVRGHQPVGVEPRPLRLVRAREGPGIDVKSVGSGKMVAVRVDHGGGRSIKKKNKKKSKKNDED